MRQMVRNGAKIVVFQREPARPPGRNPSPPGDLDWRHGVQFRVLLELRCSLTDAQSASGVQSGLAGGVTPPVL